VVDNLEIKILVCFPFKHKQNNTTRTMMMNHGFGQSFNPASQQNSLLPQMEVPMIPLDDPLNDLKKAHSMGVSKKFL